ncbi:serine/threonine-protein kinase par-1-like isoform X2 [Stylophora pistillata]|uniref:serine/threonine-protein kinase par-1-like isoform X2 n=1 Tax=Stylophora pistillata TaxID=50429 RepID=UPI000C0401CA|nr:serine/threonine-protein kinase par-1-like isoform X2 [Stylophora pistillata]
MSSDSNNLVLKRIGTYDLTGNRLGKGNFAYVELATNRITNSKVAMKVIDTRKIKDDYVKRNILREARLLKKVNHPNIVRLYETLKQHSIYCIVTEYVSGGELLTHLRSQPESKLSESQARPIMRQLISALHHMHENGIVHRDLKMENILLDESKKNIKIVDFGLSNICQGDTLLKTQCGSPEYAAPELFKHGCRYGKEVDLWSLGVVMYGIVIGRLPFRSPYFGSRGRSELLDQTSRGLSCTHIKYLVLLTPHCRDLLRKLLEPNPRIRSPLSDVMVHPWVTAYGTAPLVPNTEPLIDERLRDKALSRASQLINMDKAKIAFHVHQKRYDAVSGVYNLLLDEEKKNVLSSNNCAGGVNSDQGNSFIRVFINAASCDGQEDGSQSHESESSTDSDGQDSHTGPDWDQAPTRKLLDHKPKCFRESKPVERYLKGLRIRGRPLCCAQSMSTRRQSYMKTRPKTALTGKNAAGETLSFRKKGIRSVPAWQRIRKTRCKSCIPRFTPSIDSEVKGTQVVMSPRIRPETKLLASQPPQPETKIQPSEKFGSSGSHSVDVKEGVKPGVKPVIKPGVKPGVSASERNCAQSKKDAGDIQNEKFEAILKNKADMNTTIQTEYHFKITSGDTQSTKSTVAEGENALQMLPMNQKFSPPKNSFRSPKSGSKMSPSSLAQCINRAVSPVRTCQFLDLADYYKRVPQPPKSRSAPQQGASRNPHKEEKREERCDSFSAAYQSYVKNKKTPQHPRQFLMQAQEILQPESKFHTKYGRRLGTENSNTNSDSSKQPENQESRNSDENIVTHDQNNETHTKANFQPGIHRYLKGMSLLRDQREVTESAINREENLREKKTVSSYERPAGPDLSVEPYFHDDRPTNTNMDKVRVGTDGHSNTSQDSRVIETKLRPQQEESLKRQKEKELLEDQERERAKLLQEIEDQKRKQIIMEYLANKYTRNPAPPCGVGGQSNARPNNVPKQSHAHSMLTRSLDGQSSEILKVITKPVPILQITKGSQAEKKIVFRGPNESTGTNDVRFHNEWNNSVFTKYINTSDGGADKGTEQDKCKMNDPSNWIEQHLNGVIDDATVRRDFRHYQQPIPRET